MESFDKRKHIRKKRKELRQQLQELKADPTATETAAIPSVKMPPAQQTKQKHVELDEAV